MDPNENKKDVDDGVLDDPELAAAAAKSAPDEPKEGDEIDYNKVDYTKIDYSKLNPDLIPGHIARNTPHFTGLLQDKQGLSTALQDAKRANELLNEELERRAETEKRDPDDPLTVREAEAMFGRVVEKIQADQAKKEKETAANNKRTLENRSLRNLRRDYPDDGDNKAPDGLDADSVIREGGAWLMANKPHLYNAALEADDPAREIYDASLAFVPSIRKKAMAQQNAKLLDAIKQGSVPKGSQIEGTESEETSELMAILDKSDEEIFKELDEDDVP